MLLFRYGKKIVWKLILKYFHRVCLSCVYEKGFLFWKGKKDEFGNYFENVISQYGYLWIKV